MPEVPEAGGPRPILTVTLNPALDLASSVAEVVAGPKLRCAAPRVDPGGGGINVSRAIAALGGTSTALVALGGETGDRVARLVRAAGVAVQTLPSPGETRESVSITETATGRQFRFVLPGPVWGDADMGRVLAAVAAIRPGGFVVLSGSQPPGLPPDFPGRLAAVMPGAQMVLDTSGPALEAAVARPVAGLDVLRMDHEEAEALVGGRLESRRDSVEFAGALVARGVARRVIVARGADGSVLASATERLFAPAAPVPVVSKIGAGDSFVGAFTLALARGLPSGAALAYGVAAASAAVMTEATDLCRAADVARLLPGCAAQVLD